MITSNKPSPLHVAFGHGVYRSNRKLTRTVLLPAPACWDRHSHQLDGIENHDRHKDQGVGLSLTEVERLILRVDRNMIWAAVPD